VNNINLIIEKYTELQNSLVLLKNEIAKYTENILKKINEVNPIKYSHCLSFDSINDINIIFHGKIYSYDANETTEVMYEISRDLLDPIKLDEYLIKLKNGIIYTNSEYRIDEYYGNNDGE
jgi:hypothetical protein